MHRKLLRYPRFLRAPLISTASREESVLLLLYHCRTATMLRLIVSATALVAASAFQRIPLNKLDSMRSLELLRPDSLEVRSHLPFSSIGSLRHHNVDIFVPTCSRLYLYAFFFFFGPWNRGQPLFSLCLNGHVRTRGHSLVSSMHANIANNAILFSF